MSNSYIKTKSTPGVLQIDIQIQGHEERPKHNSTSQPLAGGHYDVFCRRVTQIPLSVCAGLSHRL
jgi:hypothetical protein